MNEFDVFEGPNGELEAVKQGFSWPAFFFDWIWAFVKKLPLLAVVFLVLDIGLAFAGAQVEEDSPLAGILFTVWLARGVFIGAYGNQWWGSSLQRRDFERIGSVQAESPEKALEAGRRALLAEDDGYGSEEGPDRHSG